MDDIPANDAEAKLAALKQEHADLDDAISAMELAFGTDQLRIARLKKRKLLIRDQIGQLEDQLRPDIIA